MKLTAWLLSALAPLTAVSVLAQTPNPVPPAPPPPPAVSAAPAVEPAAEPAAKPAKKHKAKAKHAKEPSVKTPSVNSNIVLNPPVTATVKCDVLDVRGQSSFVGEVITRLKKGDSVTVLEEITLGHVHPNEPGQWSRIVLPANTSVWVDADFIDPETKAVRVKKINVRGGPGENYSIVGGLDQGTAVKEISRKESWLEIEAPTNAYAFVASEYLEKPAAEAPAPVAAAAPPPAPVVVNVPAEAAPAPAKPAETPSDGLAAPAPTAASQADQELAASHRTPAPVPEVTQPEAAQPGDARIVTREGYVHKAYNIQAPADFELRDIKTGELTEFLQPARGQKFKIFVGTRVRIIGSESLDPRWPRTPILQIQTIGLMH
jgi:hypothetical protein